MSLRNVNSGLSRHIFIPKKVITYNKAELCITIDDKVSVSLSNTDNNHKNNNTQQGIVRFIGSIYGKPSDSAYFGIELTSGLHGKNDGKYNKIEYFRCGKKKGIFVKRNKIVCMEAPNSSAGRVTVGDMVYIAGKYKCFGTIKYIGIPSFKRLQGGNWYGIELEYKMGKTNGVYHGIKYFDAKQDFGILITSKWIKVCSETHSVIKEEKRADENVSHEIQVQHIRTSSGSLSWSSNNSRAKETVSSTRSRSKTVGSDKRKRKRRKHHKGKSMDSTQIKLKNITEFEEEKVEESLYEKIWIIKDFGHPISFLLSDKKANISILKQQIIHTFGHLEELCNQQIDIKNVDKMCLLVRIHFHRLKSFEKAKHWKFYWKKKSVSMRKHAFKKWKECILVKEIYPIEFEVQKEWKLNADEVKSFLIYYLNNLEDLLQNKSQIEFVDRELNESKKCIINFANQKARQKLYESRRIQFNKEIQFELKITTDAIQK